MIIDHNIQEALDEMQALPEVLKDIKDDLFNLKFSGTYEPDAKRVLELELEDVQNRLSTYFS